MAGSLLCGGWAVAGVFFLLMGHCGCVFCLLFPRRVDRGGVGLFVFVVGVSRWMGLPRHGLPVALKKHRDSVSSRARDAELGIDIYGLTGRC